MTTELPDYTPRGRYLRASALAQLYWATLAEADISARRATADEDPGRDAGRHLVDRENRVSETGSCAAEIPREQNPGGTNDIAPWSEGHQVKITAGDYAGFVGTVSAVNPDSEPPMLAVDVYVGGPVGHTAWVRMADVEPAEGHRRET
jgi:hypothetical protein